MYYINCKSRRGKYELWQFSETWHARRLVASCTSVAALMAAYRLLVDE